MSDTRKLELLLLSLMVIVGGLMAWAYFATKKKAQTTTNPLAVAGAETSFLSQIPGFNLAYAPTSGSDGST
jgi:hypothetical protein